MPETIALIVRHQGGYGFEKHTHLVEVILDGVAREPKTDDLNIAIFWLMRHNYEPQRFTWLDRPGLLSRLRRQVYTRPAN